MHITKRYKIFKLEYTLLYLRNKKIFKLYSLIIFIAIEFCRKFCDLVTSNLH